MCNNLLRAGSFPDNWREAKLILFPKLKPGDPQKKYRPICLINTLSKIFEHIIAARLSNSFTFDTRQHGFRKGRSTITAMESVKRVLEYHMRKPIGRRGLLCLVSLDIKNVFNSISWLDFISTLYKRNVPPYLIRIMKSVK